jgi:phage terminase small subunit
MLTPKREAFAAAVASGLNQSDAYRKAFNAEAMKATTINCKASILMSDGNVRARVEELRAPIAQKAGITLESHLETLERLRDEALEARQFSAAITAEVARGKAAGVAVDKTSLELTGKGGGPVQSVTMSPAEFRKIAEAVAAKV